MAKRKVRVEFRKNRAKRTRDNDLTRRRDDEEALDRLLGGERVRAKGELSRKRTIVSAEPEEGGGDESAPEGASEAVGADGGEGVSRGGPSGCVRGRVARVHGLYSFVEREGGGGLARCQVRRVLKTLAIEGRNVIAVGDWVWFRPHGRDEGFIERVEPRRGVITRGYRGREHVIVANVDTALVVSAFRDPGVKPALIDRYLISAERGGCRPVLVFNKADLVDPADYQWVLGLYSQLGYETLTTSAETGRGIDRLREILREGTTALSGQSGVGKSSLLNAVEPGLKLRVGEVSFQTHKGRHTTTNAELIHLAGGGTVVDTPGLRQFELWGVPPGELEGHFPEFRPLIPGCRFPDCGHTHESGCAVLEAVRRGEVHPGRYDTYAKLYEREPLDEGRRGF